ncbi:MAG: serine O-acetyltransferase [Muribaculaceae bacterium]
MGNLTYKNEEQMKATVRALANGESLARMCHLRLSKEPLPQQNIIAEIINLSRSLLFPGFFSDCDVNSFNLEFMIGMQCERLKAALENQILAGFMLVGATSDAPSCSKASSAASDASVEALRLKAEAMAADFIANLPELRTVLHTDVEAMYLGDPAAVSYEEVIYCYPAIKAIINYRIAHQLFVQGVPVIPRMISEMAHSETGIDIHPGATIGKYFAIDHGTGVVIGATAIIGENVKIYQGVTLGAKSFTLDENNNPVKGIPRHPIIGDNVVIYSNATILGRITIGSNAVIGGNIWVTTDVAEGEKLIQAKANNILRIKSDE